LSNSTSPLLVLGIFEKGSRFLPWLALNRNRPDLCLQNS
jgi:hypothetical protein